MISFGHVFQEKYISYVSNNIINRKYDRYNEVNNIKFSINENLKKISNIIIRIKNKNFKHKLIDLNRICNEYIDYIYDTIYNSDDIIFIRNYYNIILIDNKIKKIVKYLLKINKELRSYKLIENIKSNINQIDILIIKEQIKCNQYLND
ncbi:hypothetical protein IOLA_259 [uncultured bacterium]|nr:hypothetical protein IOLA_259 [uncultured bacterium]